MVAAAARRFWPRIAARYCWLPHPLVVADRCRGFFPPLLPLAFSGLFRLHPLPGHLLPIHTLVADRCQGSVPPLLPLAVAGLFRLHPLPSHLLPIHTLFADRCQRSFLPLLPLAGAGLFHLHLFPCHLRPIRTLPVAELFHLRRCPVRQLPDQPLSLAVAARSRARFPLLLPLEFVVCCYRCLWSLILGVAVVDFARTHAPSVHAKWRRAFAGRLL
jgi:hypothetical protein